MSKTVLYVVNGVDVGSSPATEARAVNTYTEYDASILAWFSATTHPVEDELPVDCLHAEGVGVRVDTLRDARRRIAEFDVVHTFHPHSALLAKTIALTSGVPSVFSAFTVYQRYNRLGRIGNAITNGFASAVTYNSPVVRDSASVLERLLNRPEYVVYNGVDLSLVREGIESGRRFERDQPLVAAAGRFIPEKGYERLIRAMKTVDGTLVLAGDGPLREKLETMAHTDVEFVGMLPRLDAIRLMYDADVFAQPSTAEGFATSPLEAMAAGTPCVLSDIDAFTEPFPRSAAFWADPTDVASITTAIEDALESGTETARRARSIVQNEYTLEATARRYADIYDEIR